MFNFLQNLSEDEHEAIRDGYTVSLQLDDALAVIDKPEDTVKINVIVGHPRRIEGARLFEDDE